ncbi:hypothetical protein AtNW77_Chr4g0319851 [Arabidopsis thaliana]
MSPLKYLCFRKVLLLLLYSSLFLFSSSSFFASSVDDHELQRIDPHFRVRRLLVKDLDSTGDDDETNLPPPPKKKKLLTDSVSSSSSSSGTKKNQTKLLKPISSSSSTKNQTKLAKTTTMGTSHKLNSTKSSSNTTKTSSELKKLNSGTKSTNSTSSIKKSADLDQIETIRERNQTILARRRRRRRFRKRIQRSTNKIPKIPNPRPRANLNNIQKLHQQSQQTDHQNFKPYFGNKYAPTIASVVSFVFILVPLLLVSLIFNRFKAYFSLQKILIFIQIYLSIYFSILCLSSLVTGIEPLKFLYATSSSTYVCLQILQTLGYVFYLLLLLMYLVLVFSTDCGLGLKVLGLAQTFVGFAVGLHYYVAVFHRVVLRQPPKTNWKIHGVYATCFLLICLLSNAERRKKEYLEEGGDEGKKN